MKTCVYILAVGLVSLSGTMSCYGSRINRKALVKRHEPIIRQIDSLSSLSVGNGHFAFTVDPTGLQTFPTFYKNGVPLGTESDWGWHSFPNPHKYTFSETLRNYDFRGWKEPYSVQFNEKGRQQDAANWFRINPHRLNLGNVGFDFTNSKGEALTINDIHHIHQKLHLWDGYIQSDYVINGKPVDVQTVCNPYKDIISARITSPSLHSQSIKIHFRFAYPSGNSFDDGCSWNEPNKHITLIIAQGAHFAIFKRQLDSTTYYVAIQWKGKATLSKKAAHFFILMPDSRADSFSFSCSFTNYYSKLPLSTFYANKMAAKKYWNQFWKKGAAVDFRKCKDLRARELERRVVLSQYLTAIQCAGNTPPQEIGLTYNSWYGKFHLEMYWWHEVHFALWNRINLLKRSFDWYNTAYTNAKRIAERQGFKGVRWMKMTDPSARESPSNVGSFLVWQQPHVIYVAELIYRDHPSLAILNRYKKLVFATADFMASFATFNKKTGYYDLKGLIPAQETLKASTTVDPPLELSYWYYALNTAQKWRERCGMPRNPEWDKVLQHLPPLAYKDSLYLAAASAAQTYSDPRFTSDHPAVLGALGMLPLSPLVQPAIMRKTLDWVMTHWLWATTWGWDYPLIAMTATRLGEPEKAIDALLMNQQKNRYLINGHNYQDQRLRIYLPGNGGLLTAIAMMCAGWDGCTQKNPGFPKNGKWDVQWEGLKKIP
ncbi:hypothetical protein [Microbacter margulisiae]|uniref:Glycosyl hydrolase family 65 n=1 Tax=Microbacter margulisiae TaxID=1350067 RepID=A0A7W5H0W5_9PORP|nr:hypothetical protein [Microbacter margulisiae]MBB3186963.1 hypothetical protein [Microbacter margulisiae]